MKRFLRISLLLAADVIIVGISILFSYVTQLGLDFFRDMNYTDVIVCFLSLSVISLVSNILFDCYERSWKNAGIVELIRLSFSCLVSCTLLYILSFIFNWVSPVNKIEINIFFVITVCMLQFFLMSLIRFIERIFNTLFSFSNLVKNKSYKKIVLFASPENIRLLAENIYSGGDFKDYKIILIPSEKQSLVLKSIGTFPVAGYGIEGIKQAVSQKDVEKVIVRKNDFDSDTLFTLLEICSDNNCSLETILSIEEYSENYGKPNFQNLRIEDLLGREPSVMEDNIVKEYITGKIVLVTGGAGSIGSEICRQVLKYKCAKLYVMDVNENGLFYLDAELKQSFPNANFKMLLGSIRDVGRLEDVFSTFRPNVVFHAAAHKHVPLMEINPVEAIKNNVFGTYKLCEAAIKYEVSKFVLISTDKAVNPTNVMGCTKRIAEMVIQEMNSKSDITDFSAVRFGNVLGSNGSVIPTFMSQIEKGGPVTVTHPDIQRYFMTIPEAVSLVLQAGAMAEGGEIFVLDMGSPIKILTLAENMIRLSGLRPYKDIKIDFTGLRPGEKMFEELSFDDEMHSKTSNEKIFILKIHGTSEDFEDKMSMLSNIVAQNNFLGCVACLMDVVHEYHPAKNAPAAPKSILRKNI